jgi:acylpyruvate hydrolase
MRFVPFREQGRDGLAVQSAGGALTGLTMGEPHYPGELDTLLSKGTDGLRDAHARLLAGRSIDPAAIAYRPPFANPSKIICIGLNYADHSAESGFVQPTYPTVFARFASSMIGHQDPIIRPKASIQLDYEGELVAVLGRGGRHIAEADALSHVAGYSIFNDGSVRDYQTKAPQWTIGKNFDGTGAFGPVFVTSDELPPGGTGLKIQTRLNGQVMQSASTSDMIFGVARLIAILSEAITLSAGDIIVSGTPSGVGMARKPPIFMKAGDVCEVEIEGLGILRNPIADEA